MCGGKDIDIHDPSPYLMCTDFSRRRLLHQNEKIKSDLPGTVDSRNGIVVGPGMFCGKINKYKTDEL